MSPGCSRLLSARPGMAQSNPAPKEVVRLLPSSFAKPSPPTPWGDHRHTGQALGPAVPTLWRAAGKSGSGWCSQSPGAGAEWGGGSHDPKGSHLPPPPPPPEGSGTKVLCTSRNHLITSSSGLGPRGPPAQSRGVGRKGTGANPKVSIKLATEGPLGRGEGVSQEAICSSPSTYPPPRYP